MQLDFSQRASGPELMDGDCTYPQFRDCLRSLSSVNVVTFAYRPTLLWLSQLLAEGLLSKPVHIVDVGCGAGDMLRRIARWARKRSLPVRLTGIDFNPYATQSAHEFATPGENIKFLNQDAFTYPEEKPVDIVISSLFTHHLTNDEIISFLKWMERRARVGWFINDLHRKRIPYQLFRILSKVAGWHPFVQHDGPLSIRRSFDRRDWQTLLSAADLTAAVIEPYRPARLCVSRIKAQR